MDSCLAPQRLFVYKHAYYKLFDEQPWYDVLGFLVVGLGPNGCADQQRRASSGIQGLLPSTSPYDIIDDGPTWVNFKAGKQNRSPLWIAPILDDEVPCLQFLYLIQAAGLSCLQIRHV